MGGLGSGRDKKCSRAKKVPLSIFLAAASKIEMSEKELMCRPLPLRACGYPSVPIRNTVDVAVMNVEVRPRRVRASPRFLGESLIIITTLLAH